MATITSNPELWVNTMLVEEHGLALDGPKPGISGIVTFAAFVGVGAVPLLPYLVPALDPDFFRPASWWRSWHVASAPSGYPIYGM